MELEHLVVEWCVGHEVGSDVPRHYLCIHCLIISLAKLIIDGIAGQSIFCDGGRKSRHYAGEFLLIKTGVHHSNIVIESWLQTEITYRFVHRIGVVAHRLHLCDTWLLGRTAIDDACKLFSSKFVFEIHIR